MILMMLATAALAAPGLPPCPGSPNCVSTEARDGHAIEPYHYTDTRDQAMRRLLAVMRSMPRSTIVATDATSVRAEFRTRIFRFTDDVMFVFDDAKKLVHFRSASRIGYSDRGVNRQRMEEIRSRFQAPSAR